MGVRVGGREREGWVRSEGEGKSRTGNEDGSGRGKKGC